MRNGLNKVIRFSELVAMGGVLSFVVFFSNCGGSTAGGPTGTGGTTGAAGTGTAGTGTAGTGTAGTGTAGAGTGGTNTTGTAGVTGSGGRFTCPSDQTLDCTGAPLTLPASNGTVTSFTPQEWSPMDGKYCNASGLRGSVFSYSGPTVDGGDISSNDHGVDANVGNFRLTLMAGPGGYAGGGISFDHCVNAAAFNALQFSAWIASGDIGTCVFKSQMQTFEQRPTSQLPPGGCDSSTASCFNFPTAPVTLTTTSQTFTIKFSDFTSSVAPTGTVPAELVGLQWQLESGPADPDGGAQTGCSVEIRIDDVKFVTQ